MRGPSAAISSGLALAVLAAVAWAESPDDAAPDRPPAAAIAHAGASTPPERSDGPRAAVDAALAALARGASPVDAAVEGCALLEDDARFNAGTGSRVRLDGVTVQMDASVMSSEGRFAAVAAIERVRNPVRVAKAVMDTPHLLLSGAGATAFARTLGIPDYDPATDEMRRAAHRLRERLEKGRGPAAWRGFDWRERWNFEKSLEDAAADGPQPGPGRLDPDADLLGQDTDTVGVAVRGGDGRFAVALSTGGTAYTLAGRVGDVPVYGAGAFAGPSGAAAATGKGERIIEQAVARATVGLLAQGVAPADAATLAVESIAGRGRIGVIVVGAGALAAASDRPMAWAAREAGSDAWRGPEPR